MLDRRFAKRGDALLLSVSVVRLMYRDGFTVLALDSLVAVVVFFLFIRFAISLVRVAQPLVFLVADRGVEILGEISDDLLNDLADVLGDLLPLVLDRGSLNLSQRFEHDDPLTLYTTRDVIKLAGKNAGDWIGRHGRGSEAGENEE